MAGYNHERGMSNNAVSAYQMGVKPLSKITKADLNKASIALSKAFCTWLAKEGHWPRAEWHHSGGTWYNEVDFYSPQELAELIQEGDLDIAALEQTYQQSKKAKKVVDQGKKVSGRYAIWGGTRRQPKLVGYEAFTGLLIGNWIQIDGGGRKKADGNHIEWSYL